MTINLEPIEINSITKEQIGKTIVYRSGNQKDLGIITGISNKNKDQKEVHMLFANSAKPYLISTGKISLITINTTENA